MTSALHINLQKPVWFSELATHLFKPVIVGSTLDFSSFTDLRGLSREIIKMSDIS